MNPPIRFIVQDTQALTAEYDKAWVIQEFDSDAEQESFRENIFLVQGAVE